MYWLKERLLDVLCVLLIPFILIWDRLEDLMYWMKPKYYKARDYLINKGVRFIVHVYENHQKYFCHIGLHKWRGIDGSELSHVCVNPKCDKTYFGYRKKYEASDSGS